MHSQPKHADQLQCKVTARNDDLEYSRTMKGKIDDVGTEIYKWGKGIGAMPLLQLAYFARKLSWRIGVVDACR